jgi:tetratricopeptide (TPR) repeat protein
MKISIKSLFVAVFVLVTGIVKGQGTQQAMTFIDAENYAKAYEILSKQASAAATPENKFALGYYHVRRGELDKAKAIFDGSDPKNGLIAIGKGMVALGNGKFTEGKALVDAAVIASKNKNADILFRAAEAYTMFEKASDPAEAIRLIDLIQVKLKKTAPEYSIIKGDAYLLKNDGGPAVSAYEAASREVDNSRALNSIARVFKRGKNYQKSQESYTNAIKADTNYAPAYRDFADLWLMAGKYKNAAFNLDKYLAKSEPTCENKLKYVKLAFLSKNYEGATRVQKEVDQCMVGNADLLADLDIPRMKGYIAFTDKNYQESVNQLSTLLAKLPAEKVLTSDRGILGRSYMELKDYSKALPNLEAAMPDTTENYAGHVSTVHYLSKNYMKSVEASEKAIAWSAERKQPARSNDYLSITRSYYFEGQNVKFDSLSTPADTLRKVSFGKKADEAMQRLQAIRPDYLPSHMWRARANRLMDVKNLEGRTTLRKTNNRNRSFCRKS